MEETQTQQANIPEWILEENEQLDQTSNFEGEKLPALQFEENKVVTFTVDFTEKFRIYEDKENKATKAIIPVVHKEEKKILWLNKKNPLYRELVKKGLNGETEFKVLQTGNKQNTKYNLVED